MKGTCQCGFDSEQCQPKCNFKELSDIKISELTVKQFFTLFNGSLSRKVKKAVEMGINKTVLGEFNPSNNPFE